MKRKLVKDDVLIIKNVDSTTKTAIIVRKSELNLEWRSEEIDGQKRKVLTLAEIKAQADAMSDRRYIITVFTYSPYNGGVIYQYGNTELRWAKIGDLYPTHA